MSNNNHTTGPWKIEVILDADDQRKGLIRAPRSGGDLVAEFYMKHDGPLIAAAPEMYSVIVKKCPHHHLPLVNGWAHKIEDRTGEFKTVRCLLSEEERAIIAKANGEE